MCFVANLCWRTLLVHFRTTSMFIIILNTMLTILNSLKKRSQKQIQSMIRLRYQINFISTRQTWAGSSGSGGPGWSGTYNNQISKHTSMNSWESVVWFQQTPATLSSMDILSNLSSLTEVISLLFSIGRRLWCVKPIICHKGKPE